MLMRAKFFIDAPTIARAKSALLAGRAPKSIADSLGMSLSSVYSLRQQLRREGAMPLTAPAQRPSRAGIGRSRGPLKARARSVALLSKLARREQLRAELQQAIRRELAQSPLTATERAEIRDRVRQGRGNQRPWFRPLAQS